MIGKYTRNILLEEWSPKWKLFRPPMWKIFRWAYNIKQTLFTGVYPVGCHSTLDVPTKEPVEVEFTATSYQSEVIDAVVGDMAQYYAKWLRHIENSHA